MTKENGDKAIPEGKLLSPKYDNIFKKIFGSPENTDILRSFLSALLDLPADEMEEISLLDPNLRFVSNPKEKQPVLDLRLKIKDGPSVNVELQVKPVRGMKARVLYGAAKAFCEQLEKGGVYGKIGRVVVAVIAYFDLTRDEKDYHHRYFLYDKAHDDLFTNLMQIDILETKKSPERADGTPLWEWAEFFGAERDEEYEMLAQRNEELKKAVMIVKRLSADESERRLAEAQERAWRDEESNMRGAYEDGMEAGEAIGITKGMEAGEAIGVTKGEAIGITKIVGNMLRLGFADEQIMAAAGIDAGALSEMRKTLS
jgi:predicted transposase/invertase (TIGR01784 family)